MAADYIPYEGPIVTRAEAKAAGLTRYFSGEPCKHGHIAQRKTVNGACWPCADALTKALRPAWLAANRDRENARGRAYRDAKSPEEKGAYYLENRAKIREQQRKAVAANPAPNRKRALEWAKQNPEAAKRNHRKWVLENPEKVAAEDRKRRARKLNAEGRHTAAEIIALFAKQGGKCAYCRISIKKGYHADHIQPLARGGTNWITNIQLTCADCNFRKNRFDPIVFARKSGLLI
jgi:5-methylcytosine-specific restriction endonuclease McrA